MSGGSSIEGDRALRLNPDEATRIDLAVRGLPTLERRILTLSRVHGKTHAEIAQQVGISEVEVKSLLVKVLLALSRTAEGTK